MNAPIALYQLAAEFAGAAERLSDLDLDEQTVADTLEGLQGDLDAKAVSVAHFVRNLESTAESIKVAEAHMSARRRAMENRAARIRAYLLQNMEVAGISKIECPHFKIALRDNPPSVVIDAESQIPADYMRQAEPPPPVADKKLIAKAIADGFEVPGCHVTRTKRVDIK